MDHEEKKGEMQALVGFLAGGRLAGAAAAATKTACSCI